MRSRCKRSMMTTSTSLMPGMQVVEDMCAERFGVRRYQGFRCHDAHLAGMQKVECMDLRARHARVQDVADDRDPQAAEVRPLTRRMVNMSSMACVGWE